MENQSAEHLELTSSTAPKNHRMPVTESAHLPMPCSCWSLYPHHGLCFHCEGSPACQKDMCKTNLICTIITHQSTVEQKREAKRGAHQCALTEQARGSMFAPSTVWRHKEGAIKGKLVLTRLQISKYLNLAYPYPQHHKPTHFCCSESTHSKVSHQRGLGRLIQRLRVDIDISVTEGQLWPLVPKLISNNLMWPLACRGESEEAMVVAMALPLPCKLGKRQFAHFCDALRSLSVVPS